MLAQDRPRAPSMPSGPLSARSSTPTPQPNSRMRQLLQRRWIRSRGDGIPLFSRQAGTPPRRSGTRRGASRSASAASESRHACGSWPRERLGVARHQHGMRRVGRGRGVQHVDRLVEIGPPKPPSVAERRRGRAPGRSGRGCPGWSGRWVRFRMGENEAPDRVPPRMCAIIARPYPLWLDMASIPPRGVSPADAAGCG